MIFITQEEDFINNCSKQSLYFYASWMPYHKKMLIMLDKMEKKYQDMVFFAIDVDHFKGMCQRFEISSIPTVIINIDGEEKKRINGMVLTSAFKNAFADICNSDNLKNVEIKL